MQHLGREHLIFINWFCLFSHHAVLKIHPCKRRLAHMFTAFGLSSYQHTLPLFLPHSLQVHCGSVTVQYTLVCSREEHLILFAQLIILVSSVSPTGNHLKWESESSGGASSDITPVFFFGCFSLTSNCHLEQMCSIYCFHYIVWEDEFKNIFEVGFLLQNMYKTWISSQDSQCSILLT